MQIEQGEYLSVGTQRPQAFRVAILAGGGDCGHDEQDAKQASKPKDKGHGAAPLVMGKTTF